MIRRHYIALIISVGLGLNATVQADFGDTFIDPGDGRFDMSRYLSENAYGVLPVPIIITDPAVDGGLGLMGIIFHESEEDKEERLKALQSEDGSIANLLPPNVSGLAAFATGNGSWGAGGGHMAFWDEGDIRYRGGGGYGDIDLDFFGYGEERFDDPVTMNTTALFIDQSLKFRLSESNFFLGPLQRYIDARLSPANIDALVDSSVTDTEREELEEILTNDVQNSGLGLSLEFDNRDNVFSPHRGYSYVLDVLLFDEAIGGDLDYDLYRLEGLNYWALGSKWRAAFKLVSEHAESDEFLPPFATPGLDLRGVPIGRIQGLHAQSAELELTYVVDERWEILGFVGAGRVANEFSELSDASNYYSRGGGFRYQVASRYGLYGGMDVAKGPEEWVFYIQVGSAW